MIFKILETSGSADSSVVDIERAIVVDPGFSARVLTLANSALMALPRRVNSIKDAVMFIGFKQVRQLAMTVGVFDLFAGKTDKESLRRRAWWRHSIDTAVCCRYLAAKVPTLNQEEAYTCGLLHYVGKTILDRFDPEASERAAAEIESGTEEREAEFNHFGCDHVQVAVAVAQHWQFPELLVRGLKYAEEPAEGDLNAGLRACVALSSHIAKVARDGDAVEHDDPPAWAVGLLGLSLDQLPAIVEGGKEAIAHAQQAS